MTRRIRRAATWALLAVAIAAPAAFVGLRLTLPSDGGRVAFYEDAWSEAGVRIDPIDTPASGLQAGDLVERIAGRSMETWAGLALDPAAARPDGTAVPYVVQRGGDRLSLDLAWAPPAIGATMAEGWSVLLFSILILGVAAFVYARRPDEPAATALVLAASGAAGSSVPWFLGTTTSDLTLGGPFVLHTLLTAGLYMVMWPAAVHLALVFPAPQPFMARHPRVVPAVYAVAGGAYLAALALSRVVSAGTLDWIGTWPRIQLAIIVPCLVLWLLLAARGYLRASDPEARARSRWAALGAATSAILGLLLFQVPELLTGQALVPASWIGLIALPLPIGLAVGILRDRLFDIEVFVSRALVYGGLTVGVLATYAIAVTVLSSVAGPGQGYGASLLSTGIAALVALPLRDGLQRLVNRLLYGDRDQPWRAMQRLGSRLEWAADPDRAIPAIADTLADALRLPYVAVEVFDEVGRIAIAAEHGSAPGSVETLPLVHGAEPVGRLLLGVRSGEHGFRADELALLRDLARQAGAAVHAQRLRDELARSRERLVVAREEERRRLRRDLHDGLGPTLAAIGMRAEAAAAELDRDPGAARAQLEALAAETSTALGDVRRLVDGLRPPALDELGLVGAIASQAARLDRPGEGESTRAAISVECRPPTLPELPAAIEVAAYRIAVEAMTNAVRHASARACRVRLEAGSQLTVEVTDDGVGLPDDPRPGTGFESMLERAAELGGELAVERRPGGGTRVLARLPLGRGATA
jgi:two-component system NarL family sensor kinase